MKKFNYPILFLAVLLIFASSAVGEQLYYSSNKYFVENNGQWLDEILFVAHNGRVNLIVANDGIYYNFHKGKKAEVVKVDFENALQYKVYPQNELNTRYNYFLGNDKSKWITNAKTFGSLKLSNIYAGIDAVLYFDEGYPRYDFIVMPGANPQQIKMRFAGTKSVSVVNNEININGYIGKYIHKELNAYQEYDGQRHKVKCTFQIDNNTVTFSLDDYNKDYPLVIDPIVFADYIGGSDEDGINAMKTTNGGYIITAGYTASSDFKTTPGVYDTLHNGSYDIIVKKFRVRHSERELLFATYIGGNLDDVAKGIDIDLKGIISLTGKTNSDNFPIINAFQSRFGGNFDAFFVRLSSDGTELLNSSYLGGSGEDIGTGLALNTSNFTVAICGYTNSRDFPIQGSADQGTLGGLYDAFVTKLRPTNNSIEFSTYWGGTNNDRAFAIAQDHSYIYFGGETDGNFPIKPHRIWFGNLVDKPIDPIYNGQYDGFAVKMEATGAGVEFSTYFGGREDDRVTAVGYFKDGSMVFAGETKKESGQPTFMISSNAYQDRHAGGIDGFIAHLDKIKIKQPFNQKYQELIFSTFFGGSGDDSVRFMKVANDYLSIFIAGNTRSNNFPVKGEDAIRDLAGAYDAYISKFSHQGSDLMWGTLFGGSRNDIAMACDIDSLNNVIIAGTTSSDDIIPDIVNFQGEYAGGVSDGFVTKYVLGNVELTYPIEDDMVCAGSYIDIKYDVKEFGTDEPFTLSYQLHPDSAWTDLTDNVTKGIYRWNIPIYDEPLDSVRIRITHVSGVCDTTGYFHILTPANITAQTYYPESRELCEGDTIIINTEVSGSNLSYQWYLNGQILQDYTEKDLLISNAGVEHSGRYKLVVIGQCKPNATSNEIEFTVKPSTRVTKNPEDVIAVEGDNVQFSVEADGLNLAYQWQRNNNNILGAKSAVYIIENVEKSSEGNYRCIINGECGSDTSEAAILQVQDPSPVATDENLVPFDVKIFNGYDYEVRIFINSKSDEPFEIRLTDILGRDVRTVYSGTINGNIEFVISKNELSSGLYLLLIESGNYVVRKKIIVAK